MLGTVYLKSDPATAHTHFQEALSYVTKGGFYEFYTLAGSHKLEEAAELGKTLEARVSKSNLYYVACGYAMCVWSAQTNGELNPDSKAEQIQRFSDRAISVLQAAVNAGFENLSELEANPELDPIRDRPEFSELLEHIKSSQTDGGTGHSE